MGDPRTGFMKSQLPQVSGMQTEASLGWLLRPWIHEMHQMTCFRLRLHQDQLPHVASLSPYNTMAVPCLPPTPQMSSQRPSQPSALLVPHPVPANVGPRDKARVHVVPKPHVPSGTLPRP